MSRFQSVTLQHPASVGRPAVQESPIHHSVVVRRPLVEEPIHERGFGFRSLVAARQRRMWNHLKNVSVLSGAEPAKPHDDVESKDPIEGGAGSPSAPGLQGDSQTEPRPARRASPTL
jgi:hypothetical protein